jgi:hypothetical protein
MSYHFSFIFLTVLLDIYTDTVYNGPCKPDGGLRSEDRKRSGTKGDDTMTRIGTRAIVAALAAVLLVATPAAARVEAFGKADALYAVDVGVTLSLCVEGCVIVGGLMLSGPSAFGMRACEAGTGVPGLLEVRVGAVDLAQWGIPIAAAILTLAGTTAVR